MKCSVTVSLVPEARSGPFVFWDDLPDACRQAAELGFHGVEVFPPGPEALAGVPELLKEHGLKLAAVGSGAGWVKHKLTLTDPDATVRAQALEYIRSLIEAASECGAPVVIGSLQGRWGDLVNREQALGYLRTSLDDLGEFARARGARLLYEPINRYETNLINTLADGVELLHTLTTANVRLLADLFHMNIEEAQPAAAIREAGQAIGHVHLADSNRRPAGCGHTNFAAVAAALREVGYKGYISAEALPWPDSATAAWATRAAFQAFFQG